jgi:hypothetical protein
MFRSQMFLFHEKPQSLLVAIFVTSQHHFAIMDGIIHFIVIFIIIIIIIDVISVFTFQIAVV